MRNHSLDNLKFLCAFLVVMLHSQPAYKDFTQPITRCAVPCFFIISGWFLYDSRCAMTARLLRSAKRMGWCLLWSTCIYMPMALAQCVHHGDFSRFGVEGMAKFILFNDNPASGHLWYIAAYLYVLLFLYVLAKKDWVRWLFYLIPVLLLIDLAFGTYSRVIWHDTFDFVLLRNWIFVGLPYTAIGMCLRQYSPITQKLNKKLLVGGVILFSLTSLAEKFLLSEWQLTAVREHYLSSTLLATTLVLWAVNAQSKESVISKIGERDTLNIYVFHIWILFVLDKMADHLAIGWQLGYSYAKPFVVFVLSLLLSHLFLKQKWIRL